jgi:hypothetical protein
MYIYVFKSEIEKTIKVGTLTGWPSHLNGIPLTPWMKMQVNTTGMFDSSDDPELKAQFVIMLEGTWPLRE